MSRQLKPTTLGERKTTGRAKGKLKRILQSRLPKVDENVKSAMFVRGAHTSNIIVSVLKDLYAIKKPMAVMYQRKNEILPFEDETSLEFFSQKSDCSLFAFGSHSKKRPHNLVLGRFFDHRVLDMMEYGVFNYIALSEFDTSQNTGINVKPCFMFIGNGFQDDLGLKKFRSIIVDFFRGEEIRAVDLSAIDHVIVCTAVDGKIHFRRYRIVLKKSGSRIPRVELVEVGPHMDLVLRRSRFADRDMMKEALRVPPEQVVKKKKNISRSKLGHKMATIHMGRQELSTLSTRRMKALKRKRIAMTDAAVEKERSKRRKTE